jgi:hypothetical protein
MSARKITNKGTKKVIGKFPSLKMNRSIWWESQLERDYIYLLEFDPEVCSYMEQPCRIRYVLDGKERSYTPDFLVVRSYVHQIIEVKPEHQAAKEENIALFRVVAPLFQRDGYEFLVVTDAAIRIQPRLDNIKLFTKYSRTTIDPQHRIACHEFFVGKHKASLGELGQFFSDRGVGMQVVYALAYYGILIIDLMKPISFSSEVYLLQSDLHNEEDS